MEIFEHTDEYGTWLGSIGFYRDPAKLEEYYYSLEGDTKALFERVCANLPCPKQFMADNFRKFGWKQFMFDQCKLFTASKLPKPVPFFEKRWCCYENSFRQAEEKGLLYVEGLAINPAGPMIHAWNSTDGTDVIDYTWPCQEVNKYFGMALNIPHLKKHGYLEGGLLGKVLLDHQEASNKKAQKSNKSAA